MSGPLSTSPAASQPGLLDPLDSLIDFTDYENATFQSPSLSPAGANKGVFTTRPIKAENTTPSLLSTSQPLSGPSHQYDLYKQQTGIVPGALATTLAVNQNNAHIHGYTDFGGIDYLGMTNTEDLFDFNTSPSQASMTAPDMDMDFDSPSSEPSFFFDATVNPTSLGGQEPSGLPSPPPLSAQTSNVGRLWPGMHQQAARAQAQAQAQQRQRAQAKQAQKPKSPQATDPIVEQKITQLLNSMRSKPGSAEGSQSAPSVNLPRLKKDEEDMDDDEKLLASEEGKKLTSKERRQLRNKVSARAFRSRRKEYISQLESEIANKVSENGDLRAQNRALVDENKRLSDLTRMLLQSPSFSDFLDRLSSNPQMLPQAPAPQPQPQPEQRQVPKDPNPYAAQQQVQQHQQIGLAMIPEQTMDFSMLNMDPIDGFSYQPQVYSAVLETPETTLDASVLSGKTTTLLPETFDAEEEKVEMPIIQRPQPVEAKKEVEAPQPVDKEFESNPAFALYHDEPASEETKAPVELDTDGLSDVDIFGGIEPEKVLARYELVNSTEEERVAGVAMARIQRISATLESVRTRLEALTVGIELEDEA